MNIVGNQQRSFLRLLAGLRPHWRRDRNLAARIQTLLARNRSFGSRDRRLYRELIYTTLRYRSWIEPHLDSGPDFAVQVAAWLSTDSPATANFRAALLADWPPCPPTVAEKFAVLSVRHGWGPAKTRPASPPLPAWFRSHCPEAFESPNLETLLARAPLWLRLQADATAARVTDEFSRLGWPFEFSAILPSALRLLDEVDVTKTSAYRTGLIEVQDLGSQLVLESTGIAPGGRWLDACAGAGGKTLQLARLLGSSGHVDAHDIRPAALRELALRATRAGLRLGPASSPRVPKAPPDNCHIMYDNCSATVALLDRPPDSDYDGVLVDAPCTGSGTWRRAPHLMWTTTESDIAAAAETQLSLLVSFAARVRPGGRLIYATCSLSRRENEDVVAAFLAAQPAFRSEAPARTFGSTVRGGGLTFLPARNDTDGFFVASLRKT